MIHLYTYTLARTPVSASTPPPQSSLPNFQLATTVHSSATTATTQISSNLNNLPSSSSTAALIPSTLKSSSSPTNSFSGKEWSRQVIKKTLVGAGVGACMGMVLGVMRKRGALDHSKFFKLWRVGMKPVKGKNNITGNVGTDSSAFSSTFSESAANEIQMVPSIFKTTVAFAGNVGLSCYVYFCIEEYLTLKQIVPERYMAHFVTACGMYTTTSFLKKLMMGGMMSNAALAVPYHLVRSLIGGLSAGCVALCASLIGSAISYNLKLRKLKRNISEEEYLSLIGVTKEEAQKSLGDRLKERLPIWLKVPSAQDRNMLEELSKLHSLKKLELSMIRNSKQSPDENK